MEYLSKEDYASCSECGIVGEKAKMQKVEDFMEYFGSDCKIERVLRYTEFYCDNHRLPYDTREHFGPCGINEYYVLDGEGCKIRVNGIGNPQDIYIRGKRYTITEVKKSELIVCPKTAKTKTAGAKK
jgi:hypothetical protein